MSQNPIQFVTYSKFSPEKLNDESLLIMKMDTKCQLRTPFITKLLFSLKYSCYRLSLWPAFGDYPPVLDAQESKLSKCSYFLIYAIIIFHSLNKTS